MLAANLKVLAGKHQGRAVPLNCSKFFVGREDDCQLRSVSDLVSPHHCVFVVDDFSVRLRDLKSLNGTFVNGQKVMGETSLQNGDRITIGQIQFEVRIQKTALPAGISVQPATNGN